MTTELCECPICYNSIDNTAVDGTKAGCITNCKHYFHSKCLHTWTFTQDQNNCPLCRTQLDMDLSDMQFVLRRLLRMKQRQPNNTKIDDIIYKLKHDRNKILDWFCSDLSINCRLSWTQKTGRVPEEKPRKNTKRGRY